MMRIALGSMLFSYVFVASGLGQTMLEPVVVEADFLDEPVVTESTTPPPPAFSSLAEPLFVEDTTRVPVSEFATEPAPPAELSLRVPNLAINQTSQRSLGDVYVIRGVGNTLFFSSAAVPFVVDGLTLGSPASVSTELLQGTEIEVFRGPQPLRFGANTPGGAVVINTVQPTNERRITLSGSYDSLSTASGFVEFSGPLIEDTLWISMAGYATKEDGYIHNPLTDSTIDPRKALGGRGMLVWKPSDEWRVQVNVAGEVFEDGAVRFVSLTGDPQTAFIDTPSSGDTYTDTQSFQVEYSPDYGTFTYLAGRQEWGAGPVVSDLDLTPLPLASSIVNLYQLYWTQELKFASDETLPTQYRTDFYGRIQNQNSSTNRIFFGGITERINFETDGFDFGWYGAVSHRFDAIPLELEGGVRVDVVERSLQRLGINLGLPFPIPPASVNDSALFVDASPELSARFALTPDQGIFGKITYMHQPGGFSGFADDPRFAQFDTQSNLALEGGWQGSFFDGQLNLGLLGYYYFFDDYQVEKTVSAGNYYVVNAPGAVSRGVEVQAQYEVVEGLTLEGSFGFTDARFTDYIDPVTGRDLDGKRLPFTPIWTSMLAVQYEHESGLNGRLEWLTSGDVYYDDLNTGAFKQSAYGLLNARVGYRWEFLELYVYGQNLTDAQYFSIISPDIQAGVTGAPLSVGFGVTGRF